MADVERTEQLLDDVQSNLGPWDVIQNFITRTQIFRALSAAQRDVAIATLCVKQELELELASGEAAYTLDAAVHLIEEVEVPECWDPVEPIEPENYEEIRRKTVRRSGRPRYVTVRNHELLFAPVPNVVATLRFQLVLKPDDEGDDDVTSTEDEPFTPAVYDEALVLKATADLIRKIPKDKLLNPAYTSEYYRQLFETELASKQQLSDRTQTRNPRSKRREGLEGLFMS